MHARVGDRGRRLRREQHQDLLVAAGERLPARLIAEEEGADVAPPMAHRRRLHGLRQGRFRGTAERADVAGRVLEPQHARQVAQVFEELRSVGPADDPSAFLDGEAGCDEILGLAGVVDRRDGTVPGPGQRAGALRDLPQNGVEVEAGVDAQDRRVEQRDALAQGLVLIFEFIGSVQPALPARWKPGSTAAGAITPAERRKRQPTAGFMVTPRKMRRYSS